MNLGTINLVFSDYYYETGIPFQCFIPWREFVFQIYSKDFFESPKDSLKHIASLTDEKIQKMSLQYQPYYSWEHPDSKVAEYVLISTVRKCFNLHWIEQKQLHSVKNIKCMYKDDEENFGLRWGDTNLEDLIH